MEIVYHLGAHGTNQARIVRTLLNNRDALWQRRIKIPAPGSYRGVFGDAIAALKGHEATEEMQDMLLDLLLDSEEANRIILSQPTFLGMPRRALSIEGLYPRAPARMSGLSNLFPDSVVEFFLAVPHPARLISDIIEASDDNYHGIMGSLDPTTLRWAPAIQNMLKAIGDRELVIWAQEDLPFIWPDVLRRIANVPADFALNGDFDILSDLLPAPVVDDLASRFAELPPDSASQRHELIEQALAHAEPDKMEAAISLPGWTQDLIDRITEDYHDDLDEIAALPGVEFISA